MNSTPSWPQLSGAPISLGALAGSDLSPKSGELWSLSWDAETLGYALISASYESHVLAWPATTAGGFSASPGILIKLPGTDQDVTVWPTRETGIGLHLLDSPIARLIAADEISPIAIALDSGETPRYPLATVLLDQSPLDDLMIDFWTELCFHELPSQQGTYLSRAALSTLPDAPAVLGRALNLAITDLQEYIDGIYALTDEQVRSFEAEIGDNLSNYLGPDPLTDIVLNYISHPRHKQEIKQRLNGTSAQEAKLREAVRSDFALAARDDRASRTDEKISDAIRRASFE